jgi:hypothetical protein
MQSFAIDLLFIVVFAYYRIHLIVSNHDLEYIKHLRHYFYLKKVPIIKLKSDFFSTLTHYKISLL